MALVDSALPPCNQSQGGGPLRIAFFSAEWCIGPQIALGGSDYWRLALPAAKLFENGWDVIFARNLAESPEGRIYVQDTTGNWRDDRDIIVLQRWMGEGTAERILKAREAGQIIVNEIDDDYWNFPEGHVSMSTSDPELNKASNREHYRESVAASSLITVSTQYLADELSGWGPPVKLIRNYVDGEFWRPQPPGDYVGWVGGLPWRGKDIELLADTVVPWLRERKQFFYHGGAVPDLKIEDRLGYDRVATRSLCGIAQYPRLWEPIRVALCPIDDTPFGRAKSWIKGLEAGCRGVPFIHSAHAEYEHLGAGLCVREPDDWAKHLEALEDPVFYEEQREASIAMAKALDITQNWSIWAETFQEATATV